MTENDSSINQTSEFYDESKEILKEIAEELSGDMPEETPVGRKFSVSKIILDAIGIFIMLVGISTVLYFIWGPARGEFHSDSTDTIYWAEAAMQGNGLLNPDFQ